MKKILYILLALVAIIAASCLIAKHYYSSPEEALEEVVVETEDKMTYFYLNPNAEDISSVVDIFEQISPERPNVKFPIAGFLKGVKDTHPEYIAEYSTPETIEEIIASVEFDLNTPCLDILEDKNLHIATGLLDFYWGYFSATGSEEAVKKVICIAKQPAELNPNHDEITQREFSKFIIISAAKWSLDSNIEQHEKVKEIAIKEGYSE